MILQELSKEKLALHSACPVECRNKLLKLALLVYQDPNESRLEIVDKYANDFNIRPDKQVELIGFYLQVIRLFAETSSKEFNAKLVELNFSNEFIDGLPLVANREKIFAGLSDRQNNESCKLVSLKWRIDVSLTNSSLGDKVSKSVIVCIRLKNGRQYTLKLDPKTFHSLRFNIALILKELNTFEAAYKK